LDYGFFGFILGLVAAVLSIILTFLKIMEHFKGAELKIEPSMATLTEPPFALTASENPAYTFPCSIMNLGNKPATVTDIYFKPFEEDIKISSDPSTPFSISPRGHRENIRIYFQIPNLERYTKGYHLKGKLIFIYNSKEMELEVKGITILYVSVVD